jgi:5'(3')-deoxyribonucleotidase
MKLLIENWRRFLIEQEQTRPKIFCDMDGVLADFEGFVIDNLNNLISGADMPWEGEKSSRHDKRLKLIHDEFGTEHKITEQDLKNRNVRNFMYSFIKINPGKFYLNMYPLRDGLKELWPELINTGLDVYILSASILGSKSSPMTSEEGKKAWIAKHGLNPIESIIVQGDKQESTSQKKASYAVSNGQRNILIDDTKRNVDDWEAAGGIGILHIPKDSQSTIEKLQEIIQSETSN